MKINGPSDIHKTAGSKPKRRSAGSGGSDFASLISGADEKEETGALGGVSVAGGLLGLQEFDDEGSARQQYQQYGKQLLDRLDQIRHALLTGTLPIEQLKRIQEQLARRKPELADPHLRAIIQEIEVRAAVELAKWERNR